MENKNCKLNTIMKKYIIVFLLPFALLGCEEKILSVNELTFYIEGVYYDLSKINDGRVYANEFSVQGARYNEKFPLDSLFYAFMGYNVTTCGDCDCAYGGQFLDRSVQKETFFNVPDPSIYSYFWIRLDTGRTYDAISGYIQMINVNVDKECVGNTAENHYKAYGTFDFVMVNRENELDTIHVTNGKFRYQRYFYGETYYEQWEGWEPH